MTLILPWISWITALTLLGIPRQNLRLLKRLTASACLLSAAAVLFMVLNFDGRSGAEYQFVTRLSWLPALGIDYVSGVDGLGLTFCLLTALVSGASLFSAFTVSDRLKEYLVFFLLLSGAFYGVFTSMNLFFVYVFYEVTLLAVYPMIAVWGTGKKEAAAIQMAVMTGLGAVLALFGLFLLYQQGGPAVFDFEAAPRNLLAAETQIRLAPLFLIAFGLLSSLWPLHSWAPAAYASAPASAAMLHAGIKAGPYLLLRVAAGLLPEGMRAWADALALAAAVGIVYAAYAALRQKSLRLIFGFSGVSHLGYVFLGLAAFSAPSVSGAVFLVFAHGILTAALFSAAGTLSNRTQHDEIQAFGGLAQSAPFLSAALIAASMASLGMPGFANFASELMILLSTWSVYPWLTGLAVLGILLTSVYLLRMIQAVCYGKAVQAETFSNLRLHETLPLALLIGTLILFGLWPSGLLQWIEPAIGAFIS